MTIFLEIHALQSTPPCNMNRDQNGSPKTAFFGGMERIRVSSQSWKRAMRQYYKNSLPDHHKTYLDRSWGKELANYLEQEWFNDDSTLKEEDKSATLPIAWMLLSSLGVKAKDGNYEKGVAETALFLGDYEIRQIVTLANSARDLLIKIAKNPPKINPKKAKRETKSDDDASSKEKIVYQLPGTPIDGGLKTSYKGNPLASLISEDEFSQLKELHNGIQGVLYNKQRRCIQSVPGDIALFGRMMASLPIGNVDASATVAHAISTNVIKREFDYWTAAGDFEKKDSDQGQGGEHIGDRPFSSGVFYRYSCLDIKQLITNLGETFKEDLGLILKHYLEAFLYSRPSGYNKQFGNDTPPFAVMFVLRKSQPLSLVQAFETPIKAKGDESISQKSWHKIIQHWNGIQKAHGKRLPVEVVHVSSEELYEDNSKQIAVNPKDKEDNSKQIAVNPKDKEDNSKQIAVNPRDKEDNEVKAHFYEDFSDAIEAAVEDVRNYQEGS